MSEFARLALPRQHVLVPIFDAMPRFDDEIPPQLQRLRFFRLALRARSRFHAAYTRCMQTGDAAPLLAAWRRLVRDAGPDHGSGRADL